MKATAGPPLLLLVGAVLAFIPSPAVASPGCGAVITSSTTLTADIGPCPGSGLVIGASYVTLDCAGHAIRGTNFTSFDGITIDSPHVSHVAVVNCLVTNFHRGFYIWNESTNYLKADTVFDSQIGFLVDHGNLNTLRGDKAIFCWYGFELQGGSSNVLENDIARGGAVDGFTMMGSSSNFLMGDLAKGNGQNGYDVADSPGNTFQKSRGNLNPNGFLFTNSSGTILTGNSAKGDEVGFGMFSSEGVLFTNNRAIDDCGGFWLTLTNSTELTGNTAVGDKPNCGSGIEVDGSHGVTLSGNVAKGYSVGYYFHTVHNVNVTGNRAVRNGETGRTSFEEDGFALVTGFNVTFAHDVANRNAWDGFDLISTTMTLLSGNTASGNHHFGYSDDSSGAGTSGTANAYSDDTCTSNVAGGSSPAGLGTPQR
jgi:parallel beta-helix repeat protein